MIHRLQIFGLLVNRICRSTADGRRSHRSVELLIEKL